MTFVRIIYALGISIALQLISFQAEAAEGPSCGLNTGKAATGEPIPLGSIVGKTGPDDFSGAAYAAKAYFDCVNANGGIHGRPVSLTIVDDQWNPEVAKRAAGDLNNDKKVVAMVGNTSFVDCAANSKYYETVGLTVIAGVGVPSDCFNSTNYVPVNGGPRVVASIAAQFAKQRYKAERIVCMVLDVPGSGNWACEGAVAWGRRNGVMVNTMALPPAVANPEALMAQAAAMKPDAILLILPRGQSLKLLHAARQQDLGRRVRFLAAAPVYSTNLPKTLGAYWNGNLDIVLEFQPVDATTPDNRNWLAVMKAYGPPGATLDNFSQSGFLAAKVVTTTLLKMLPDKVDRKGFSDMVRKAAARTDLLCTPFYVGIGGRHNPNKTGRMVQLTAEGFRPVSECIESEDPELEDIFNYEKNLGLRR